MPSIARVCKITNCTKPAKKWGFICPMHNSRISRYGSPDVVNGKYKIHGLYQHELYVVWCGMKGRCNNPSFKQYGDYGGRGIKVCERWNSNFPVFLQDMGERPEGMTLERIDNDGNYEPSNCKWVSRQHQMFNRRMQKRNKSGFTGVSETPEGKWKAVIGIDYKRINLGVHSTPEEAHEAYAIKRESLGF